MATDHILALLLIERDKLDAAIEALQGPTTSEAPLPVEQAPKPAPPVVPAAPAKRKLSAAGRRAIIAATKKRWAAIRAAKAAPAPVAVELKAAPAKAPAAAKRETSAAKSIAFRKKMSERMKAAWAARKKKAAAKGK